MSAPARELAAIAVSEALVHVTPIQVRFGDTDRFGHINNASFATYAEIARIELITSLGHPLGGMILAHMAIDFRRQLHVGDALVVWTRVARIGRSSIGMSQENYRACIRAFRELGRYG